jgi:hypothetical protein
MIQREAQMQAYRALQEALDRRDNGGRSTPLVDECAEVVDRDDPANSGSARRSWR